MLLVSSKVSLVIYMKLVLDLCEAEVTARSSGICRFQEKVLIQFALQTTWALFVWLLDLGSSCKPCRIISRPLCFSGSVLSGDGLLQGKALEVFSPPRWFHTAPCVLGAVGNMCISGAISCPRCGGLQCCAILSPNSALKSGTGLVKSYFRQWMISSRGFLFQLLMV